MFKKSEGTTVGNLLSKNYIFAKFWLDSQGIGIYKPSLMPGNEEGVSGTILGGTNVGINNCIEKEQQDAAGQVIKYMTSLEGQKKFILESKELSAISSLYDDEEVCKINDCQLMKNIQPIGRPSALTDDYDKYSAKFRKYIYDFLYEDGDAYEVLQKVEDILKIYTVKTSDREGLIVLIATIILMLYIISAILHLFINRLKYYFNFIDTNNWLIIFLGLILILAVNLTQFNDLDKNKCHLKAILCSYGYTFINIPILYKLIDNFPKEFKLFKWIKNNQYEFLLIFILYDFISLVLFIISSFQIKVHINDEGKNYGLCKIASTSSLIAAVLTIAEKVIIMICIAFFLFLEWNIVSTKKDILSITSALYVDVLAAIILIIIHNVEINHYKTRFLIYTIFNLSFVCSHYFFIYGLRIIFALLNKSNEDFDIRKRSVSTVKQNIHSSELNSNSESYYNIIIKCHNYTGEEFKKSSLAKVSSLTENEAVVNSV